MQPVRQRDRIPNIKRVPDLAHASRQPQQFNMPRQQIRFWISQADSKEICADSR
jgi:hypothetical protein